MCPKFDKEDLVGASISHVDDLPVYGSILNLNCTAEGYLLNNEKLTETLYCQKNGTWSMNKNFTCSCKLWLIINIHYFSIYLSLCFFLSFFFSFQKFLPM